ncbi:hypothetical protein GY45DRAFT_979268 [Cubamyces sp. BRFM 1775]|nr:hypothetical protein GY45DRAFT_979268 [Cubamyces sp. BRFM 1775]
MRAVSIPTWATLRDQTESSAAPSEDELQSRASQEMDEITSSPPARQTNPQQRKQVNMAPPPSTSRVTDASSNMQGPSTGVKHTSTANARRLLSGSDEEEELRPKKKRKRRIVDPEKGPAVAKPRVSLDGRLPTDPTRPGPSSQASAPVLPRSSMFSSEAAREARRQRRVTMDTGILAGTSTQPGPSSQVSRAADKQSGGGRPPAAGLRLPRTIADPPLQRAQARRKSGTNLTGKPDGESSGAGISRPRAPNSSASAPAEIIEILDSDDEPPPPTQPTAVPEPPAPPPRPNIPRRTKHKTVPVPRYREDNGVIILDDDDDLPPPPPPRTHFTNHVTSAAPAPVATLATRVSPARQASPRRSPMTATVVSPVEAESEPAAPEADVEDIEMADEELPGLDMHEEVVPPEEPAETDEQPMDGVATSDVHADPDEPPDDDIAMDEPAVPPDPQVDSAEEPTEGVARSPSPRPALPEDEAPPASLPVSEDGFRGVGEVTRDSDMLPATLPSGSEGVTPSSVPHEPLLATLSEPKDDTANRPPQPPLSQPQPQPALPASLLSAEPRERTESPVSAMLDPPLKDLSISDISTTSPRSGTPPPPAASPKLPVPPVKSPPPATAKPPSPATPNPSTPQRPRVQIKSFLYGGPDGFFAPVHRLSQKRLSQASPLSQGTSTGASPSKAGQRASDSLSPTASRVARVAMPSALSQDKQEQSSTSTASIRNLTSTQLLGTAEKPQTEASEMLGVRSAALVKPEVSISRAKSPAEEAATQIRAVAVAAVGASPVERQEDHFMEEDYVKETQEPTPGLEARTSPGEAGAERMTGPTPAAVLNSALDLSASSSAPRDPTQVVSSAEEDSEAQASVVTVQVEEASSGAKVAERSDTPPPTEEPPQPRTLSQIIRKAVNEIARNEVIDLTFDDSDNEPTAQASSATSKPAEQGASASVPPTPAPGPPSNLTSTGPPSTPAPASQPKPIRTLDLSALNNIRKQYRASLGNQLSPTKPGSSSSPLPLPRNVGRGASAAKPPLGPLSITLSPPVQRKVGLDSARPSEGLASSSSPASPPTHPVPAQPLAPPVLEQAAASAASEPHAILPPAQAHVTPVLPQGSASSASYSAPEPLLSQGQPKPMLPRLRDIIKASQAARAAKSQSPPSPSPQIASSRDADKPGQARSAATSVSPHSLSPQLPSPPVTLGRGAPALSDAGSVESVASVPALEGLQTETPPPRSSSPEVIEEEMMEEEECLSLIYPDTAGSTPDIEVRTVPTCVMQ